MKDRTSTGKSLEFNVIFEEYRDRIYAYLCKLAADRHQADDIFQEAFLKVHQSLPGYRDEGQLKAWIYKIALNAFRDHYRKSKSGIQFQAGEFPEPQHEESPDKIVAVRETGDFFERQISALPVKLREVYLLRMESGLSFKEIASVLDEPMPRVLKRMQLAVQNLRDAYQLREAKNAEM